MGRGLRLHARGRAGAWRLRLGSWRGLRRAHLVAERCGQLLALQVRRLGDLLLLLRTHGIAMLCRRAPAQVLLQPLLDGLEVHRLLWAALWGLLLLDLSLRMWASTSRASSASSSIRPLKPSHGILLLLLLLLHQLLLLLLILWGKLKGSG